MIDPYDNWLAAPHDDYDDDEETDERDDDGAEAFDAWEANQREREEDYGSPYYDGT